MSNKRFFKSKERVKRKSESRTRKMQAAAKLEKDRFLNSEAGRSEIEKLTRINAISKLLAAKV